MHPRFEPSEPHRFRRPGPALRPRLRPAARGHRRARVSRLLARRPASRRTRRAAGLGRFTYEPQSPAGDCRHHLRSRLAHQDRRHHRHGHDPVRARTARSRPAGGVGRARIRRSDDPRRQEVTMRTLLAHTSGLPGYVRLFEQRPHPRRTCAGRLPHAAGGRDPASAPSTATSASSSWAKRWRASPMNRSTAFAAAKSSVRSAWRTPASIRRPHWRALIPPTEDDRTFRHRVIQGEVHDENASVMGGVAGHAGAVCQRRRSGAFCTGDLCTGGAGICSPRNAARLRPASRLPSPAARALWASICRLRRRNRADTSRRVHLDIWASPAPRCGWIRSAIWRLCCSPIAPGRTAARRRSSGCVPASTMPSSKR